MITIIAIVIMCNNRTWWDNWTIIGKIITIDLSESQAYRGGTKLAVWNLSLPYDSPSKSLQMCEFSQSHTVFFAVSSNAIVTTRDYNPKAFCTELGVTGSQYRPHFSGINFWLRRSVGVSTWVLTIVRETTRLHEVPEVNWSALLHCIFSITVYL